MPIFIGREKLSLNRNPEHLRCCDRRYNHPRFCGYTKLRKECKGNTVPQDCCHNCRDFGLGRPTERDKSCTEARPRAAACTAAAALIPSGKVLSNL